MVAEKGQQFPVESRSLEWKLYGTVEVHNGMRMHNHAVEPCLLFTIVLHKSWRTTAKLKFEGCRAYHFPHMLGSTWCR